MRLVIATCLLSAIVITAGCTGVQPLDVASVGAAPPMSVPVGPIPGPSMNLTFGQNPYAQDRVALVEGRQLFVWYNCYGCHGGHGGGGMGPSLRDVDWIYGSSDAHVFDSIAKGRAHGMPAWGMKVPEEQIWKLVGYVRSLNTTFEPDPPPADTLPKSQSSQHAANP